MRVLRLSPDLAPPADGERRVLASLVDVYPKEVDHELVSEKTGYQRSSRDKYLQRLGARRLLARPVVNVGRGQIRAAEKPFSRADYLGRIPMGSFGGSASNMAIMVGWFHRIK